MSQMIAMAFSQSLKLPQLFSDHMVLQREEPVRFWGWSAPGEEVRVDIDGFEVATKADANGKWVCLYPAHKAGGPFTVTVTASQENREFTDVWFGDVWVAGGQSNMEWKIGWKINDAEAEIQDSNYPQIRFFEVPNEMALSPQIDIDSGEWIIASPQNAAEFSAVAWFFAKHNHLEKGVPVGIIDSNWGGTPAESWASAKRLVEIEGYKVAAKEMLDPGIDWEKRMAENKEREALKWKLINDKDSFLQLGAHKAEYDDSDWETIHLPTKEPLSDFVWVRKTMTLKSPKNAKMYLGDIDQIARIFVNGTEVAEENWQDSTGVIDLSFAGGTSVLQKGENVIAIRAINSWNNQVRIGRTGQMWLENNGQRLNLEGEWKYINTLEQKMPEVEFFHWRPGMLFNAMIHPIAGYTIAGTIWYQGESNSDKPQYYNELFEAMIQDWRMHWKQGSFPFLFVQLANFMERKNGPSESQWAELREAQAQTLELPNTGMATIIDIGEAYDIHPRNKQNVGKRLWLAARKVAYGEDVVYSGPVYESHEVKDGKVYVSFDHIAEGLAVKGEALKGFELAGKDGKFYTAEAQVDGEKVILSSGQVQEPVHIRYAWADNPAVSLYNKSGLPAVPFRTGR